MQLGRRRFQQGLIVGLVLVLVSRFALEESPLADWLVSPLLVSNDHPETADMIVVAGAGVVGPCQPNLSAVRRVLSAVSLWDGRHAPLLMFTGGAPEGLDCAVSVVMADLAARLGVPRDRLLTETKSRSTRENAVQADQMLRPLGVRHLILVTDQLHMFRASRTFEALGYAVSRASVPVYATHRGNFDMLTSAVRESASIAYYWSRGWLASPRDARASTLRSSTATSGRHFSVKSPGREPDNRCALNPERRVPTCALERRLASSPLRVS
ncbi:YdcF family protein [Luteitalea sp.]|uniref:YdcF family protein n=1 Tax=Luteitalea sp. TaxID=2004800 RepID=UPI0025B924A8|nr:YdcF family protein [Luteitalea sp.]